MREPAWAVKVECTTMSGETLRMPVQEWRWIHQVDDADPTPRWWQRRLFDLATAIDIADAWKGEGVPAKVVRVWRREKQQPGDGQQEKKA